MSYKLIDFPVFEDERGLLLPFELEQNSLIPFPVKRVYLVQANDGQIRGGHAHQQEQDLFIAVGGNITTIINNGEKDEEIILKPNKQGLYVPKMCWHEFTNFSPNATLLCFSSVAYSPGNDNYIMNKKEFLTHKQ
jgi:dTDP-4-dehydrorhamnose 3,5-epimerase-like enzyme